MPVVSPVETHVQAVLGRLEELMLVHEGPKAARQLVPLADEELSRAVGFELGSCQPLEDIFAATTRDVDDPRRFGFERTEPVLLLFAQHLPDGCRRVRVAPVGCEPAQPLEGLRGEKVRQKLRFRLF